MPNYSAKGRPTVRNEDLIDQIIDRVTGGEPLAQVLRDPGMPSPSAFYEWLNLDPELDGRFARAREHGHDAIAAEALAIANTPMPGVTEEYERRMVDNPDDPDGEAVEEFVLVKRKVADMIDHRKLQIDTRIKLISKWDRRYSDRLQVDHDAVGNLADDLRAARERAKADG